MTTNKLPIIDLGISKEDLKEPSNPTLTLLCSDLEGYEVSEYSKVTRSIARGGDYIQVTFRRKGTEIGLFNEDDEYTLPALLTCGLGVIEDYESITIQLKGFKGQNNRFTWTPWIIKFNPPA